MLYFYYYILLTVIFLLIVLIIKCNYKINYFDKFLLLDITKTTKEEQLIYYISIYIYYLIIGYIFKYDIFILIIIKIIIVEILLIIMRNCTLKIDEILNIKIITISAIISLFSYFNGVLLNKLIPYEKIIKIYY